MIHIVLTLAIIFLGFVSAVFLFYRIPGLPALRRVQTAHLPTVSVIIPARNEAHNLPLILQDLLDQTHTPLEIICVDDASEDETAHIAASFGIRVITLSYKPEGWLGKSWACHNGALAAQGELMLFLDADVRLGRDALSRLLQAHTETACTMSVQPFHTAEKTYEQFSLFFNLVQIAANGTASLRGRTLGLYGPLILIAQTDYRAIDGHASVRGNIIEDVALGKRLSLAGLPHSLYVGDTDIRFRMYAEGPRSLLQGWLKNQAAGAAKTPLSLFLPVFLWISSLCSVPLQLVLAFVKGDTLWILFYFLLYLIWLTVLSEHSKRIGQFRAWAVVFYPLPLLFLVGVFFVSVAKKLLGLNVTWKGRAIRPGDKA